MFDLVNLWLQTITPFFWNLENWGWSFLMATAIYGSLGTYLHVTHHVTLKPTSNRNSGCIDCREECKYKIPGGVGTYSMGMTPLFFHFLLWHQYNWDLLLQLAQIQFLMSLVDILLFAKQMICADKEDDVILLLSHGLRHPGCGRTGAWCPIGAPIYVVQILSKLWGEWKWLGTVRGVIQLILYDIPGVPMAFLLNIPFFFIKGNLIVPRPW